MGERHWLAVQTKRTLMTEECNDEEPGDPQN